MACGGYPGTFQSGHKITGIGDVIGAQIFQAGTKRVGADLVTAGGRVLGVTARGSDLSGSIARAYAAVERIHFEGMHYRKDIGAKGLRGNAAGGYNASVGT
jgi:phosphoribosylamine--glycine ligase